MKLACLLVLIALTTACRSPGPGASVPDRERALGVALIRRDSVGLDELLHPDFPAGVPEQVRSGLTRGTWITIMTRRFDLDTVGVGDIALVRSGDTARARLWIYWRGRVGSAGIDESLFVADTWVRRRGIFRLTGRDVLDCRPRRAEC